MSKVLVVEDNSLNLKLFNDLLVIRGYEVLMSRDGVGVVELAEREQLSLILMDIQLSGISGVELIKKLKGNELTAHIPIIAITAFAMKNDEIKIINSGCNMYLAKPVSIEQFYDAINKFVPNERPAKAS